MISLQSDKMEAYHTKLKRAQKRVSGIKEFYAHLKAYIVVNVVIQFLKPEARAFFDHKELKNGHSFLEWFDWNLLIIPMLWGIALVVHAIIAFQYKPGFLKNWEQKQYQKFLEADREGENTIKS